MQHASPYGLPTPSASPVSFDRSANRFNYHPGPVRFVPPPPEARLGRYLGGSLRLTSILGTGAYGVVYTAVDEVTNIQYAVKALSKFNPDGTPLDRRQVAFQTREIKLHHLAAQHRNVVSILKIFDEFDSTYVILEFCQEGDLFYNITERGQYVGKDDLAKRVFLQLLDAVEFCHSLGIYHRDLKPENILVSDRGQTVKLADFGLATACDRSEDYGCGSTFYMSPECLDHSSRKPWYACAPNDVWSLGVILVNLTSGRNPWKQASLEDSTYRAYLQNPGFLKTILPLSDELDDILSRIFTRDPEQRITLPELRARIAACPGFTEKPSPAAPTQLPSPPTSPEASCSYADYDESAIEDDSEDELECEAPPSPASSQCSDMSTWSDEGSLISSGSSQGDSDDEDRFAPADLPQATTPPPQPMDAQPVIIDPDESRTGTRDFVLSVPDSQLKPLPQFIHQPSPVPASGPRLFFPNFWSPQCRPMYPTPFYQLPAPVQGF